MLCSYAPTTDVKSYARALCAYSVPRVQVLHWGEW